MKCRNNGKDKDIIWFGKDPSLAKTLLWYSLIDQNSNYKTGYVDCPAQPSTIVIDGVAYNTVFDEGSDKNGVLKYQTATVGKFCWTSAKVPTYVEDTDAVCASLAQRLRVIKGELWYQINYGLPLAENYKSRAVFDAVLQDIITSHPGVSKIESFESKIDGNTYTYNCEIRSIFGESFSVSSDNSV